MQVHILMFGDRIERASMDASRMYDMAKKMNSEDNPFGPYNVISIELEDTVLTSQFSGLARLVENQQDMPPEFNQAVDKMLDDELANR